MLFRARMLAALVCLHYALPGLAQAAETAKRPNVLFIAVDDLKPTVGCYGDALARTPNIDRLAARGTLFERAYCMQAVCAPSRNGVLTGLRPQTLRIYDLGTNFRTSVPRAVTLPQHFQSQGWKTEALGKIFHVGHGNHEDPASWSVPHWGAKTVHYLLPENRAALTREQARFENKSPGKVERLPRGALPSRRPTSTTTPIPTARSPPKPSGDCGQPRKTAASPSSWPWASSSRTCRFVRRRSTWTCTIPRNCRCRPSGNLRGRAGLRRNLLG